MKVFIEPLSLPSSPVNVGMRRVRSASPELKSRAVSRIVFVCVLMMLPAQPTTSATTSSKSAPPTITIVDALEKLSRIRRLPPFASFAISAVRSPSCFLSAENILPKSPIFARAPAGSVSAKSISRLLSAT